MNSRSDYQNHSKVRDYFRGKLELDDEEFDRRFQIYLEIFPFLAIDFRLRDDCHLVHKSSRMVTRTSDGGIISEVLETEELDPHYHSKANNYAAILQEIRDSMEVQTVELDLKT